MKDYSGMTLQELWSEKSTLDRVDRLTIDQRRRRSALDLEIYNRTRISKPKKEEQPIKRTSLKETTNWIYSYFEKNNPTK